MTRRLGSPREGQDTGLVPLPSPFLPSLTSKRGISICHCQKPKKYRWVFPFPHPPHPGHQQVLSSHLQTLPKSTYFSPSLSVALGPSHHPLRHKGNALLCPLPDPLRPPGPTHKLPATPQPQPSGPSAGLVRVRPLQKPPKALSHGPFHSIPRSAASHRDAALHAT